MHVSTRIQSSEITVQLCKENEKNPKTDAGSLLFGHTFTDHMLRIDWNSKTGWNKPQITPLRPLTLHPAAKVFHYALELFEGMKAYRGFDNKIRLFRPDLNMKRMLSSAERLSLPLFDAEQLLECMKKLIKIDVDWIPEAKHNASLYIRPTLIGVEPTLGVTSSNDAILYVILSPVGAYFKTGIKPVKLIADPKNVRAWPGGSGNRKLGSNYAPTIAIQKENEKLGYQQIIWLFGDDHQLTEVGAMNLFVFLINENGEKELVTPPLDDGIILPGVTRISLLELARQWKEFKVSERKITMKEVKKALQEKRLLEIFGSGTACSVCPVGVIHFQNEDLIIPTMEHKEPLNIRFLNELSAIQYGKKSHPWAVEIC
ncbi:branched-chain-amino-acid aminotransferase: cytosolic-like protein [Leptotrombidium deliense]|uniref:Branched-chain-amino-acid aminotransferase n=1 Tax=Leptotrombidium deliense TaxID=299467 RepID=A0A443SBU9_9ACAR|nr:branched-chain-amino-acid aminotransferase: cytosolic-like protein [Leptotrombidium deliense]